jgi:hypothetical protein
MGVLEGETEVPGGMAGVAEETVAPALCVVLDPRHTHRLPRKSCGTCLALLLSVGYTPQPRRAMHDSAAHYAAPPGGQEGR